MLRYQPRSGSTATLHAVRYRLSSNLRHDEIGEARDVSTIDDPFWAKFAEKTLLTTVTTISYDEQ